MTYGIRRNHAVECVILKELMFGTTERQDVVDDDENDDVDDASRYLRKWTNFNCPLNFLKA